MEPPILRDDMIQKLKEIAPIVTQVTATDDMGFEFSAIVPDGVIYAAPGMLLAYSGGQWPPHQWEYATEEELEGLLRNFLLNEPWEVTAWEDLSNEEIEQWFEDAEATQ